MRSCHREHVRVTPHYRAQKLYDIPPKGSSPLLSCTIRRAGSPAAITDPLVCEVNFGSLFRCFEDDRERRYRAAVVQF